VSTQREKSHFLAILGSLGWPLLLGLAAWIGFYALIHQGTIRHELVTRYFAGHPVEYVETAMFFVGLAVLVIKAIGIVGQFPALANMELSGPRDGVQRIDDCPRLLKSLRELPGRLQNSYPISRLRDALEYVLRKGSADQLDDQLRDLADRDADRLHEGYSLVRIIIWATPMLGFLGTVIGITLALGDLSPNLLVNAPEKAMEGLLAGLSVAFDTTALALSLSIVLMFAQFLTDRIETQLLAAVDRRTAEQLVGRFQELGTAKDPHLASVRRMAETVVASTEKLVERQVELWRATIDTANQHWNRMVASSGEQLETALAGALSQSIGAHAAELVKAEQSAAERSHKYAEQLRGALVQSAEVMKTQQAELVQQGQVMARAIEASGQIAGLQQSLNENLKALAGAKNFEDTVMSLSAAIHLLSARMDLADDVPHVELGPSGSPKSQGRAA